MTKIASELERLTHQLNQYQPMSEANVAASQAKMSEDVNTRLQLQSQRVNVISESV